MFEANLGKNTANLSKNALEPSVLFISNLRQRHGK